MDTLSYKTLTPNAQSVEHKWVVIDATDQVLGRLCATLYTYLKNCSHTVAGVKPSALNVAPSRTVFSKSIDALRLAGK